jgi:fibronectin type 3 domain-containing protein
MDFAFEGGGSDDGGSQGGGGGGDDGGGGGGGGSGGVTAQVTLEWDANTEPDLDGYKLYYGTSGGIYDFVVDAGDSTTCTVINLTPGETYYFAATAYNTAGAESAFSNEIIYSVPI